MTTPLVQAALLDPEIKKVLEQIISIGGAVGGSPVAAGVTVQEFGAATPGAAHTTVLTLNGVAMTFRDTQQGNGVKLYTFPKGKIGRLGASAENIQIVTTSDPTATLNPGITGNFGVGSTTQANATVATTEQDIVQVAAFTSSATQGAYPAAARGYGLGSFTMLDGSSTPIDVFFNAACATATDVDADATVKIYGTVTINWIRT